MFSEYQPCLLSNHLRAKRPLHQVDFFCHAKGAQQVALVGDFNEWNPTSLPMQRMQDGSWWLRITLAHGHHRYYLLVDGKATLDENALGTVRNDQGWIVSLLAVS